MANDFTGAAYELTRDLDIKEIAKRVRVGLRQAQELGGLPEQMTFRVTIDRFAGGQALRVAMHGMPDSWIYNEPGREPNYAENIPRHGGRTAAALDAERVAQEIVNAYNYDRSDIQSDYFNVRFYDSIKIVDEREQAFIDREKARKAARRKR